MAEHFIEDQTDSPNWIERQKALSRVITCIRESLDLQTTFQITVAELRKLLLVEYVGVLCFERDKDGEGEFICEDVAQECESMLGTQVNGSFFRNQFAVYQQGIMSTSNYLQQESFRECYVQMLQRFDNVVYIVAPLYIEKSLWGLLCVHQCQSDRYWQSDEIEFVSHIAEHLDIVLQHHNLLQQTKYQAQQQAEYLQQVQEQAAQLARASERDLAAQRQQALAKMIDKVRQSLDIDIIFTYCTEELRVLLEAERVAIYRFRPDWSGEFVYEAQSGGWTPLIQHQLQHPELCDNISECTFKELCQLNVTDTYLQKTQGGEFRPGEPFRICNDIYNANLSQCYIQALERYQARAYAIIAVYQGQKVWGLLAVYQNSQPRSWQASEIDLLVQISKHLGIALQQADYLQKLQAQANQLIKASERQRSLITTVDKIRQSLDIDTIFKATTQEVRQLLEVERVAIYRFYPDWSGEFVADSIIDGFTPIVTSWKMSQSKLLEPKKPGHYPRNETFVPILQGEKLWGLLVAYQNSAPRYWQEEEINLLAQVGVQLGVALQQAELLQQTQKQALELAQTLQDLQRTQGQLIQGEKMASLGQLVAGVAHEINNPINFIYGNLEHLSDYTQDLLNILELYQEHYPQPPSVIRQKSKAIDLDFIKEDLRKILSSMQTGTERVRDIVLSLRNFSRLDQAEKKAVDIHEGIDSTLLILRHRLSGNSTFPRVEVIKEYTDLPLVECYPAQLNQVFMNIISNAIDALEEKWLKIPSSDQHPQIRIRTKLSKGKVLIFIADNGLGITERVKSKLFDPFFTTKPPGKGTGLGLSISYQIVVEKHRGNLDCSFTPGKGTEFIIDIPVLVKE